MKAIERAILPVYRVLPKNAHGYIERRSLRFVAYRYFMKKSALLIRGFEPSRALNSSNWGSADILSQRVPAYVESVLQSEHAREKGFNLRDAVLVVATLEQLIFDAESTTLEAVYASQHKPMDRPLNEQGLGQLLETYMVHWMLGDDAEGIAQLAGNPRLLKEAFPHWDRIVEFAQGQMKTMQFQRERMPRATTRPGRNALSPRYSFEDAHSLVGGITKSFASFWESECASMKDALVEMDTHRTGRVPLSKFYHSSLDSDWRFGESEAYLRELGVLDESSWRGKQVIIPNYIQAASNCIIAGPHYMVCCINDCEAHLEEIEAAIGAPTAPPSQILAVVRGMTSTITLDDDEPPHLEGMLTKQLAEIAAVHGGEVPLSGRLFAQWLHYVFPRECAFPHKVGETSATPVSEFGDSSIASDAEKQMHVTNASASDLPARMDKEELQWMSQWSSEEELILEEAASMRAPWEQSSLLLAVGYLALPVAALAGAIRLGHQKAPGSRGSGLLPTHSKAHFV